MLQICISFRLLLYKIWYNNFQNLFCKNIFKNIFQTKLNALFGNGFLFYIKTFDK